MSEFEDLSSFEWEVFGGFPFEYKDDESQRSTTSSALPVNSEPQISSMGGTSRKPNKRKFEDVNGSQSSLEAQVRQLRNELRKGDKLRERMSYLEEQNSLMKVELKRLNTSPQEVKRKNEERVTSLTQLIRGFNSGDVETIKATVKRLTSMKCSILTPSLFQELRGEHAVIQFFTVMLETFPDGFFELTETELEENGVVISKFTFSGTKVSLLPSDMLYEKWKDLSLEEIIKKKAASHIARSGSLQASFLNIRAAPSVLGQKAAAVAAVAQTLPASEITDTFLDFVVKPPAAETARVVGAESTTSEEGSTEFTGPKVAAKSTNRIKISGHIIATYDASTEEISRIIFVWNTTSLLGQIFGFSDGDLEVLNGVMNLRQNESGGAGSASAKNSNSSSSNDTVVDK